MPQVGNKKFPYTPKGKAAAKKAAAKMGYFAYEKAEPKAEKMKEAKMGMKKMAAKKAVAKKAVAKKAVKKMAKKK